ncbi:chloride channel protein [Acidocella aminolytica]|uniref:Chloride channel protein n=1 Tax=Acidocella aminolytica 101 = DSM 11237 TaxID=1120923 RepID=A0A0D6PE63_9PROT|nr:chloride channel protein [Acidocella aminolytica]GAN80065.1 chloride channel protein [Acidocella aminolytica 101 = DSM 11237]
MDTPSDRPRFVQVPRLLRALVRADEVWLAMLAAVVGLLAGLGVVIINSATRLMHQKLFDLPAGQELSQSPVLDPLRAIAVPMLGGVILGVSLWFLAKIWPRKMVDPIEANAMYGGRMSLLDSLIVAMQTAWSNGVGASVGMEAGYAQLGAGIASWLGKNFRVRRNDLRTLVGCGAAAAIAGAFNAPLCGAFYGIELIIGVYSVATLPFVVIAALVGTLIVQVLGFGAPPLIVNLPPSVPKEAYGIILIEGVACGIAGIVIMRGVTLIEEAIRRSGIPIWLRPLLGGAVVGLLGCLTPKAMSSGHSALHSYINVSFPFLAVAGIFLAKAIASAFSIGTGFRGGLFFASLFLGALFGKVFAGIVWVIPFVTHMPAGLYAIVGMSGLAAAIVGGPMTMTFLALETTANFAVTMAVLAAAIAATITVRRLFGYSFATWRFHLRGEQIRSAVDVGWIHALTVGRMMRPVQATTRPETTLAVFRQEVPLGATQRAIVTDSEGQYAGIVYPAEAAVVTGEGRLVKDILHHQGYFLLPGMNVKEALDRFEKAEADALAVLDGPETRHVLGLLTEQYALRRYNEELDRKRREVSGE